MYANRIISVVFSAWTGMLDLLEQALHQEKIGFERLDGSKSLSQRRQVLHNFRNEESCIVLLATFGTAGVGSVLSRGFSSITQQLTLDLGLT